MGRMHRDAGHDGELAPEIADAAARIAQAPRERRTDGAVEGIDADRGHRAWRSRSFLSASGKLRLAIFAMGRNCLVHVSAPFKFVTQGIGYILGISKARIETRPDDPLCAAYRERTGRCDLDRKGLRDLFQLVRGMDALNQAVFFHFRGVNRSAGANQFECAAAADNRRQPVRPARARKATPCRFGELHRGMRRRKADIAGKCEFGESLRRTRRRLRAFNR